jgi:hypothetical protein
VRLENAASAWQLAQLRRRPAAARPPAGGSDSAAPSARPALQVAFALALVALTLLDRFGLRLSDGYSISPSLAAMYGLVAAMLLGRSALVDGRGVLLYGAVVTAAALSYVVNSSLDPDSHASIGSLMLVFVLYAPFVLRLRPEIGTEALWRRVMRWYVGIALVCAVFGIVQFYAQFVVDAPWLFDYTASIPAPIRGSGVYNTINPVDSLIKSNGFFLREASGFSFYMALAMLCEATLARRKWVFGVLGLALLLSYSGSGLLALGAAMLFPLGRRTLSRALIVIAAGALVVLVFGDALNLSYTLGRVAELDSDATTSSAYCRFVSPARLVAERFDSASWSSFLGHGPGTTQKVASDVCETTYGKLLFEYGLVGTIAFGALILAAIGRSAAPIRIRVALVVSWLLLGGNLVSPDSLLLIFLVTGAWPAAPARARTPRARAP